MFAGLADSEEKDSKTKADDEDQVKPEAGFAKPWHQKGVSLTYMMFRRSVRYDLIWYDTKGYDMVW